MHEQSTPTNGYPRGNRWRTIAISCMHEIVTTANVRWGDLPAVGVTGRVIGGLAAGVGYTWSPPGVRALLGGRSTRQHNSLEASRDNMWTRLLLAALALAAVGRADDCKCNKGIGKYYAELGCRPVKEGGACCPTKFDCAAAPRSPDKCQLRGKSFDPKARVTGAELGDPCVPECRCDKFGKQASFRCVSSECPDLFQEALPENCVRLYAHGTCCSTGTHCDNATTQTPKESKQCQFGGRTYVFGQKFYPKEEPCKACICQQGFDGTLAGPWCQDVNCGIELHYGQKLLEGCAPIHFGTAGCCPIGWRCPSASDSVVPSSKKSSATASKCTFGTLRLDVGDQLSQEKTCVECRCSVPPHVACVQRGYC